MRLHHLGLAALLAGGAAQANLLVNGSFESGVFTPNKDGVQQLGFGPGPLPLAGWSLFLGDVYWVMDGNSYGIAASDGVMSLSLYDPSRLVPLGSVQQSISSTPGTQFQLSFDLGSSSGFPRPVAVTVQAAGQAATFSTSGAGGVSDWQHFSWNFTANDTTTVIYFGGASGGGYIGLDNAVLVAVPEPPAPALWLAGMLGVFGWTLRVRGRA